MEGGGGGAVHIHENSREKKINKVSFTNSQSTFVLRR